MAVAVEVHHSSVKRGSELRLRRERPRLEPAAPVQEHLVVERRRLPALSSLQRPAQHILQRGVRVRGVRARGETRHRQGRQQFTERGERSDPVQTVVILGLDHVPARPSP